MKIEIRINKWKPITDKVLVDVVAKKLKEAIDNRGYLYGHINVDDYNNSGLDGVIKIMQR